MSSASSQSLSGPVAVACGISHGRGWNHWFSSLCTSVCSVLLPPTEPSALTDLRPLILDAVVNLGTKNTLRRALHCAGISHTSSDSVRALRSLLLRYRDTFAVNEQSHPRQRGGRSKSEDDSGVVSNLTDIANAWPQRISHTNKARIVHDFRAATSSNALETITCASCAEKVRAREASDQPVSVLDLDVLRAPPSVSSDSEPPLPYTEGPLAGILVDPSGVHYDEDGTYFLYFLHCLYCSTRTGSTCCPRCVHS